MSTPALAATPAVLLELDGVRKSYNLGLPNEAEVLHGVSLRIGRGEFAALIGPSGSGKSTLLNIIGLLERMTTGSYSIEGDEVVGLDDAALADRTAHELGHRLFDLREQLRTSRPAMADALDQALADVARPQILVDVDDTPGGGAGGDNTEVLRLLLSRGVKEVCAGPLWDPLAVRFCFDAGVGARLRLRIGGKVSLDSGAPLDVHAEVLALQRNHHQRVGSLYAPLGDAAAVCFEGIEVVLTSVRDQAYAPSLFSGLGIDCTTRRFIVLKSAQQFHLGFDAVTTQARALRRPARGPDAFQRVRRPLWPLDEDYRLP
jgi:microcystin degradation protein MlrC